MPLAELIAHLRQSGSFAYDSEFIGELTLSPQALPHPGRVAAARRADRPAGGHRPAAVLGAARATPSVEKIVHAGQQDIEPVVRHLGRAPANVFDTQIAAGFVGAAVPGVAVEARAGADRREARQGADVHRTGTSGRSRPMQLRYAADDVRYLPLVRARDRPAAGRAAATRPGPSEECDAQCDPALYRFDPDTAIPPRARRRLAATRGTWRCCAS